MRLWAISLASFSAKTCLTIQFWCSSEVDQRGSTSPPPSLNNNEKSPRNHSRWHAAQRDVTVTARTRCVLSLKEFEERVGLSSFDRHHNITIAPARRRRLKSCINTDIFSSPIQNPASTVVSQILRSESSILAESVRMLTSFPSASIWSPTNMNN
jgi:hypothetical protein